MKSNGGGQPPPERKIMDEKEKVLTVPYIVYEGAMARAERRGRDRMGRYTSRDGGYSGHDGVEDIMMDVRQMPESERRKLKSMLERM